MGKVFKKTLLGFSREQVIAYIDALVEKQKAALLEEKEKNKQLEEENLRLSERIAQLEENEDQISIDETSAASGEEIRKLKGEKEELFESLKNVKSAMNNLQNENIELKKQLESPQSREDGADEQQNAEPARDENQSLKAEIERLSAFENENSELKAEIQRLSAIERENQELMSEITRLSAFESENRSLKSEIERLSAVESENSGLKAEIQRLSDEMRGQKAENTAENVSAASDDGWDALRGKIFSLADDLSKLAADIERCEKEPSGKKASSVREILDKVKKIGEKV